MTPKQLQLITETLSIERATIITNLLNQICPKYGIEGKNILEEFLATIIHESGAFRIKEESLNYTTPERIVEVWPSRFTTKGDVGKRNAADYIKQPQKLANTVYNGRMGNRDGTNDGWAFRGSGFIQLTGRDSFVAYGKYKNISNLEQLSTYLRTSDMWAIDSACWEFAVDKKLIPFALKDDFITVTKRINGGLIGWKDRQYFYNRCKKYL